MEIQKNKTSNRLLSISFIISSVLIAGALIYSAGLKSTDVLKKKLKTAEQLLQISKKKLFPQTALNCR